SSARHGVNSKRYVYLLPCSGCLVLCDLCRSSIAQTHGDFSGCVARMAGTWRRVMDGDAGACHAAHGFCVDVIGNIVDFCGGVLAGKSQFHAGWFAYSGAAVRSSCRMVTLLVSGECCAAGGTLGTVFLAYHDCFAGLQYLDDCCVPRGADGGAGIQAAYAFAA